MTDKTVPTKRETECLYWAAQGKTTSDTAVILNISSQTVRWYLQNVLIKLESTSVAHAVYKGTKSGLLP